MSHLSKYYPDLEKQKLQVLEELWEYAKSIEPNATEGLSYGLPALKLNDRPLIGFSIAKNHMSVYPFSPKIIDAVKIDLDGFQVSKGLIRFTEDNVVPRNVIELMIALRKEQLSRIRQ